VNWFHQLEHAWPYAVLALTLVLSLLAAGHALLYKRDPRSAALWMLCVGLLPLAGAVLYFVLGVNRIKRRAILLRGHLEPIRASQTAAAWSVEQLAGFLPATSRHLTSLARATDKVLTRPLLPGNRVELLAECYDPALAHTLGAWFDAHLQQSRLVTLDEVDARSLPVRLRDGAARLFTPFL